ncbi:hypothetical protein [Rhodococcus sp. IEGM 1330]|uniref:hypothetical protein n=1 Tax=Rhodococcus sp. IEGM 1330 TaxID=3082225 RepID=UPI002952AC84|nr:hypothetical protein [Rhodococcus sp. IEGM 1330]MDV8021587.1 hypothetical protein [Rhodococcus sp. IEGM 1330]
MTAFAPCERVIVGSLGDRHVDQVVRHLPARSTVVIDAGSIPDVLIYIDDEHTVAKDLTGSAVSIGPPNRTRGWIRRLAEPSWDNGAVIGSRRAAELATQLASLSIILRDPMIEWLTPIDTQLSSENKMLQARDARALQIPSPEAIIGGSPEYIRSRIGEQAVVKPLGPGNYEHAGEQHIVYAQAVPVESLTALDTLNPTFLSQRLIRADRHLRIVTVADRTWGAALLASGLPLDWRMNAAAHSSFAPHDLTIGEINSAQRIAQKMGVRYSAQDWIQTNDGKAAFIDLNPGGQWLFLPRTIAGQITAELAKWLGSSA